MTIHFQLSDTECEALEQALASWVEREAKAIEAAHEEAEADAEEWPDELDEEDCGPDNYPHSGPRLSLATEYALIDMAELLHAGQRVLERVKALRIKGEKSDHD